MSENLANNNQQQVTSKSSDSLDDQNDRTITLSYKELLHDKLSRRCKSDLDKLQLTLSRKDQSECKADNFVFPSYLPICGHIHDFYDLLDSYNENSFWQCPTCKCNLQSIRNIKVFKFEDIQIQNVQLSSDKQSERKEEKELQQDYSQFILDLERKIEKLSLIDYSSNSEEQKSVHNCQIDNSLSDVSIGRVSSQGQQFSPLSLKAKQSRYTLSTNSSQGQAQSKSGPNKSLMKMLEKQNAQEFKMPSPKINFKEYNYSQLSKSNRNRSLNRENNDDNSHQTDQLQREYSTLKKRTSSSKKYNDTDDKGQINIKQQKEQVHQVEEIRYSQNKRQRFN